MFDLAETLSGVRALLKDVTNIIGVIDKNVAAIYRLKRRVQRQRELQKLRHVLFDLTRLAHHQITLPDYLDQIANLLEGKLVGPHARFVQEKLEYEVDNTFEQFKKVSSRAASFWSASAQSF